MISNSTKASLAVGAGLTTLAVALYLKRESEVSRELSTPNQPVNRPLIDDATLAGETFGESIRTEVLNAPTHKQEIESPASQPNIQSFSLPIQVLALDGKPVRDGTLSFQSAQKSGSYTIDAEGRCTIKADSLKKLGIEITEPISARVKASAWGFIAGNEQIIVLQPGENETQNLYLDRGLVVEIQVLDAVTRESVTGAHVMLDSDAPLPALGMVGPDGRVYSDHDRSGLGGILPGTREAEISVTADGYPPYASKHNISSGMVQLLLPKGVDFKIVLVDAVTRKQIKESDGSIEQISFSGDSLVSTSYSSEDYEAITIDSVNPKKIVAVNIRQRGYMPALIPLSRLHPLTEASLPDEIDLSPAHKLCSFRLLSNSGTPFSGAYFLYDVEWIGPDGKSMQEEEFSMFEDKQSPGTYIINGDNTDLPPALKKIILKSVCSEGSSAKTVNLSKNGLLVNLPLVIWEEGGLYPQSEVPEFRVEQPIK